MSNKGYDQRYCQFLWVIPTAFFLVSFFGFCATFTIGVHWENISPFFPFISETGEQVPEGFIFAFIMNSCSFLGFLIYIYRYFLLEQWMADRGLRKPVFRGLFRIGNKVSLFSGVIGCFGAAMVGNIEMTRSSNGHFLGVLFSFFGQMGYMWMHLGIDWLTEPISRFLAYVRVVLVFLATLGFAVGMATLNRALEMMSLKKPESGDANEEHWVERGLCDENGVCQSIYSKHPDHSIALICIFMEWFTVAVFATYMGSFAFEFRRFSLSMPQFAEIRGPGELDRPLGVHTAVDCNDLQEDIESHGGTHSIPLNNTKVTNALLSSVPSETPSNSQVRDH